MNKVLYRKFRLCFLLLTVFNFVSFSQQGLKVSSNGRFLVKDDGKPFFYLADTGWELFHRLSRNDAYAYLANRASKGFTVIQVVLLSEINGLTEPNANGDLPLTDLDPTKPNEAYFKHVDALVDMAASMDLYMAILPTWGSWAIKENHPLFKSHQIFDKENARVYGQFVGSRYKTKKNIIWVLGGDRNPPGYEALWEAMAEGLKAGDGGSHLVTYHPTGNWSSSAFWHKASWLDFNMVQSGHATRFVNSYDFIRHDYVMTPVKPTFDGETNYEELPVGFHYSNGLFTDYDVRTSSYFSVFAGGFGITYGCNSIWQMYNGKDAILNTKRTWKEALDLPGAGQMRHLRALMESRPFLTRIPDQTVLLKTGNEMITLDTLGNRHLQATRDGTPGKKDASYIMVYSPIARSIKVATDVIPGKSLKTWWYDPRQGLAIPLGVVENKGSFEPGWNSLPWHNGAGPDWVLVIDDAAKNYPPPGQR